MDLYKINKFATDTANYAFTSTDNKEMIRDSIIDTIAVACICYSRDPNFKREIDSWIQYRQSK